jgi:cytochrome c oxidase assembly factor CtaG
MSYLTRHWSFDPTLILIAAVVVEHEVGLHHLARRSRPDRTSRRRARSLLFYAGLGVLVVTIISPIDHWSGEYFYVHMVSHILIMFFAPILIVLGAPWLPLVHGVPVGIRRRAMRAVLLDRWAGPLRFLGRVVTGGWFAVVFFNLTMVFWHIPALFDAAETNQAVHIWLMHSSFLLGGVLFWLQIIPSYPLVPKLSTGAQIAAILATNVVMIFLAMALSIFSASSWYSVYDHLPGVTMSPFASQQIGAAILWVCGDFWAFPALVILIKRAAVEEGGASALVDRMLHATPAIGRTSRG